MAQQLKTLVALTEFGFQRQHGDLQPSTTLVPGDPLLLTAEGTRQACGTHTDTQAKHPYT